MLDFIKDIIGKGKYEVSLNSKGEYYFRLKASNGEIILVSESYKNRKVVTMEFNQLEKILY